MVISERFMMAFPSEAVGITPAIAPRYASPSIFTLDNVSFFTSDPFSSTPNKARSEEVKANELSVFVIAGLSSSDSYLCL